MKYKNLTEVKAAFDSGELSRDDWYLALDNDYSALKYCGAYPEGIEEDSPEAELFYDKKNDEGRGMYEGKGYYDLKDMADAAGIPAEWV